MSYSNQTDILARQVLNNVARFTPILKPQCLSGLSEEAVELDSPRRHFSGYSGGNED